MFAVYLLRALTLLVAATALCFALLTLSPIDPVRAYVRQNPGVTQEHIARMEQFWGVGTPPIERYVNWLGAALRGDLGDSLIFRRPVLEIIAGRAGASLALMFTAWTFSGLFGLAAGCLMGMRHRRLADRALRRFCLVMCSVPAFWVGLLMLGVFSVRLGWFPFGMAMPIGAAPQDVTPLQWAHHIILPALTLSVLSFPKIALHTREKLLEVLASDYVLFARARGLSEWEILRRHALPAVLIPALTMQFASFGELFGGSLVAESIFSYPGLGMAAAAAGLQGDAPLLLGITLFSALLIFVGNAIANALYPLLDPRQRGGGKP